MQNSLLAMNITKLHFYVPISRYPEAKTVLMPLFSPSAFQLYASIFIGGFTGLNVGAVLGKVIHPKYYKWAGFWLITLISLITVQVGINIEGMQKLQNQ